MKKLTVALLTFAILVGCTALEAARNIKDWKTVSTLFCGLQEETEITRVSRNEAEYWISKNSIPEGCTLMERCGSEQGAICGSCYEDKKPNLKIDDINNLRNSSGNRYWTKYKAIKIQDSKRHERFRILNFRSRNTLDFSDWKFYPTENNALDSRNYYWETEFVVYSKVRHTLNRETLVLDERQSPKNHNMSAENRTYSCRLIQEKEIDIAIEEFKEFQSSYYKKQRKIDRERKLKEEAEQEKKNKI